MLNIFWGEKKPEKQLSKIWKVMQPFLFGTIGAAIKVSEIDYDVIPKALAILSVGMVFRLTVTYF